MVYTIIKTIEAKTQLCKCNWLWLVMIDNMSIKHLITDQGQNSKKTYRGKMILLPRLFRGYRGNFPAAPVESAPMVACVCSIVLGLSGIFVPGYPSGILTGTRVPGVSGSKVTTYPSTTGNCSPPVNFILRKISFISEKWACLKEECEK